jgi:glycosyltransferase involved in cell wall biosynthesis
MSARRIKLELLRFAQRSSFWRAEGLIFLSEYARATVLKSVHRRYPNTAVIPHGIEDRFRAAPRVQLPLEAYSREKPFQVLYVSSVDMYKHQWVVAEAIGKLRRAGLPVAVDFVGPTYKTAAERLHAQMDLVDPVGQFLRYRGAVPYEDLPRLYHGADAFAFASTCENLPNILLEAMASGLPIACSSKPPMPAILGNAGVYFDAEDSESIANAIGALVQSPGQRAAMAERAFSKANAYDWNRCAAATFEFLRRVACP